MGTLKQSLTDELTTIASLGSTIAEEAAAYGIEIMPICKALDVDPQSFNDLTARISLDRLCRLMEACAVLAQDEAFGLRCAARFVRGATGPFGYGLMAAPTVRDFITFLADNIQYATHTSYCRLSFDDKHARLQWTFAPMIVKRDQYVDLAVRLVILRLADIGLKSSYIELDLERSKPRDASVFRESLCRKIGFDAGINELRIKTAALSQVNPGSDPRMFKMMSMQCRALQPSLSSDLGDIHDQVRRYVSLRIADRDMSLQALSGYFGISERTLQRRLAESGTSIQALRDDTRRQLSLQLLTQSDLSIAEIGYRLGYSRPGAFTRSVIRWFKKTPSQMRPR